MRKIMFVLALLAGSLLNAQDYQLTYGNAPFTELASPVSPLDWPFDWDDETAIVPFGFSFPVGDLTYDSLFLSSNGWAVSTDAQYEFNAYYVDLIAAGDETSVAYKTENVDGENVLKIEFLNAGFYEDTSGTARTSFQFWFYESGCWESRIGPSIIVDTVLIFEQYPGPFIGYANYTLETVQALVGPSNSPELLTIDSIAFPSLNDVPNDGAFYAFCEESAAALEHMQGGNQIDVFPNPATTHLFVRSEWNGAWIVSDLQGRIIAKGLKNEFEAAIELTMLSEGMYFFQPAIEKPIRFFKN
jgi:hypothetical protein